MAKRLSVIVPTHNEEANVGPFYDRTKPVLDSLGLDWEIVFVNDASTDRSLERVLELRRKDPRVRVITLSRNFGYHAVLVAGLSSRESELYAIIDADCEDPPELLADFHKELAKGAHTAYGIRSQREEPRWIIFFRWLFYWINRMIADGPVMLWMAEFVMITRTMRDALLANKTSFPFLRAEIGHVGLPIVGINYQRAKRQHGSTHYNFFRMTRFALAGFLSSSTFPLRIGFYLSAPMLLLYILLVGTLRLHLAQASQLAAIFLLAYVLLTVPMLSIYLARTYKNGLGRPVFYLDPERTHLE